MPKVRLDSTACFLAAAFLLLLPLRWLLAACLAAAVHELWHIGAIRLTGGDIREIRIRAGGAVIETSPMEPGRELICALAGPVGGLSLLMLTRWLPCTAVCALIQSAYNLLPFFPLDGGRVLHCALILLLGERRGEKAERFLTSGAGILLLALAVYGALAWKLGILPVLWVLFFLIRPGMRKIPCKTGRFGLQ